MILVDTSVWIAIIRGEIAVDESDYEEFYTCAPVVQEVLQGFNDNSLTSRYFRYFLDVPRLSDPRTKGSYLAKSPSAVCCRTWASPKRCGPWPIASAA